MISRIYIDGFRSLQQLDLRIAPNGAMLCVGPVASGKSSFCDALATVRDVACGFPVQLPANYIGATTIQVEMVEGNVPYVYQLVWRYEASRGVTVIEREYVSANGTMVINREGNVATNWVPNGQPITYAFDPTACLLPTIPSVMSNDPVSIVRRILSLMLIVRPAPCLMAADSVTPNVSVLDMTGSRFCSWLSFITAHVPGLMNAITPWVRVLLPNSLGCAFVRGPNNLLHLRLNRLAANGQLMQIPFSALSDGEKRLFLLATLCGVAQTVPETMAVLDDPLQGLPEATRVQAAESLCDAFQISGQLLLVSSDAAVCRGFGSSRLIRFGRVS